MTPTPDSNHPNGPFEEEAAQMGRVTVRRPVQRVAEGVVRHRPDALAAEEPLELRVGGRSLAVTMRTPGHDVELAHGFLLTEGVIGSMADIATARYCDSLDEDGRNTYNVLDVALAEGVAPPDDSVERRFYTTSSCGVCGKASLDAVRTKTRFSPATDPVRVSAEVLFGLPDTLRAAQKVFDSTGGLHGAGLFAVDGTVLTVREDVGRHNAVDKVLGHQLMAGAVPAAGTVLMVSGAGVLRAHAEGGDGRGAHAGRGCRRPRRWPWRWPTRPV